MKFKYQMPLLVTLSFVSAGWLGSPLQAALESRPLVPSIEETVTEIAASWGEIRDWFRRQEVPGGSRGNRNQPTVCAIVPGTLVDKESDESSSLRIWSLDPVFVWQGEWSRLEVFHSRSHEVLLSKALEPGEQHLVYSEVSDAMPLEPDGAYYWNLSREADGDEAATFGETSFRTLDAAARQVLEDALTEQLVAVDDGEEVLRQRVTFFVEQGLWADAFRELYAVEELPAELAALKAEIAGHTFCNQS